MRPGIRVIDFSSFVTKSVFDYDVFIIGPLAVVVDFVIFVFLLFCYFFFLCPWPTVFFWGGAGRLGWSVVGPAGM